MTIAYEILQDILDVIEVKLVKHADELHEEFHENYRINETLSGDEDDYSFEHEDL